MRCGWTSAEAQNSSKGAGAAVLSLKEKRREGKKGKGTMNGVIKKFYTRTTKPGFPA
jgi:hypothetical protein